MASLVPHLWNILAKGGMLVAKLRLSSIVENMTIVYCRIRALLYRRHWYVAEGFGMLGCDRSKGRSVIKASLVVAIMNMCGEISCVLWGTPVLRSCLREFYLDAAALAADLLGSFLSLEGSFFLLASCLSSPSDMPLSVSQKLGLLCLVVGAFSLGIRITSGLGFRMTRGLVFPRVSISPSESSSLLS